MRKKEEKIDKGEAREDKGKEAETETIQRDIAGWIDRSKDTQTAMETEREARQTGRQFERPGGRGGWAGGAECVEC